MNLENLRRSYLDRPSDIGDFEPDPVEQFRQWFAQAQTAPSADWFEPNAMTLASADTSGRVSARIVLLKKITAEGFTFFTNYLSDKAQQFDCNPQASLVFYWPHIERQVRVEGTVSKTDSQTSDSYFQQRPRDSQMGAVVSPQSKPVADRVTLENAILELARRYGEAEIPRPEYWGGYMLSPYRMEFWQGRPSRLHDRFLYTRNSPLDGWTITRLAP